MDALALLVLIVLCALVVALLSGNPTAWAREEWRRMWADTWAEAPKSDANTAEDPRVKATLAKLEDAKEQMKFRGTQLLIKDRPSFQRVNPMGKKVSRPVISIRRTK